MRIISRETIADVNYDTHYLFYRLYRDASGEEKHALMAKSTHQPSGETILATRDKREEIEKISLEIGKSFAQGSAVHLIKKEEK